MFRFRFATGAAVTALAGALLAISSPVAAQARFFAIMTHDQETVQGPTTLTSGAPRPLPSGTAIFTLNASQTALSFQATIYNIDVTGTQTPDINDNLVAAHIHAPAPLGLNAGVKWGFYGAPFNNNNPNDSSFAPFVNRVGGTFQGVWNLPEGNNTTLAEQLPNILAGLSYINFHTVQFGGGEIRGQIVPGPPDSFHFTVPGQPLSKLTLHQGNPPILTFHLVGSNGYVRNGQTPIPTLTDSGTILSVLMTGNRVSVIATGGTYESRDGFIYVRTGP